MTSNSDDVNKRVPALFAGQPFTGRFIDTVEAAAAKTSQVFRSSHSKLAVITKSRLTWDQQKNIIAGLLAINLSLIGLTAHQDHPGRVQQAQAIEAMIATKSAKEITIQPVKSPIVQVAEVAAEKVEPTPAPTVAAATTTVATTSFSCLTTINKRYEGDAGAMVRQAAAAKWGAEQANYLMQLMGKESGLNPYACNRSSGACGIPQAYPCSKLIAAIGSLDNVEGQIQWLLSYVQNRYGTPYNALAHHWANNWY